MDKIYKILIQFPTRERPDTFFEILEYYINLMSDKENYIINVNCDIDDESMNNETIINKINEIKNCRIKFSNNKSKIEAVNSNIDSSEDWDIILLASDDMKPEIYGYDDIIRKNFNLNYKDLDGVLWFNDGYQKNALNTLCILGKKYYNRFGYIYHPSYKSLWCDNEFTIVANKLNKQKYFDQIIIRHVKPGIVDKPYDNLYIKNQEFNNADQLNFVTRLNLNFPL